MREMPVQDAFAENGVLGEYGRMVHSMYPFEVKKPEESKGFISWLAEVPGDQAFRPVKEGAVR
jgi:branched-chain amino acid transport system substrate-binding protein